MKLVSKKIVDKFPADMWKKGNFRKNEKYCPDGPIPTIDSFYFRLNHLNLFYTQTKEDNLVFGAIELKNIVKTLPYLPKGCFKIVDKEKDEWMLCSTDGKCPKEWKETIDKAIG